MVSIFFHDNKTYEFGNSTNKINLKVRLTNKSIEKKLFRNPALHFGEGYMNKEIIIEEGTIEELIDIVTLCYDDFVKNNFIFRVYENFSGYFKVFQQCFQVHEVLFTLPQKKIFRGKPKAKKI